MTLRLISIASLLLVSSLAACNSDIGSDPEGAADGGPEDPGPDGGDPGAPMVVSVTPANNAAGVLPDAEITIEFDRAMDQDSVEAAWSSADIPADAVSFTWNQAGDTVTVVPDELLPVAEGGDGDPDEVLPLAIEFEIGIGATDQAGAPLAYPVEVEFETVRRFQLDLEAHKNLTGCRTSTNQGVFLKGDTVIAGDTSDNLQVKTLVSFSLRSMPAGALIEEAVLDGEQISDTGIAFKAFGALEAVRVRFDDLATAFGAGSLGALGSFSNSVEAGKRALPVTDAVAADLADGSIFAQFRLEFPIATNGNDTFDNASFSTAGFALRLTYLVE